MVNSDSDSPHSVKSDKSSFLSDSASYVFQPQFDERFQQIVLLADALFEAEDVRIAFACGDRLRARAVAKGELSDQPLDATLCGLAIQKEKPMDFSNAQENEEARFLSAVLESGVSFYSNRLIRINGGEVIGTFCVYDKRPRTLNDEQRGWLDALAGLTNQLVQDISGSASDDVRSQSSVVSSDMAIPLSRLNFSTLFEMSPAPTAVLSYPEFRYVAVNNAMLLGSGIPLEQLLGSSMGKALPGQDGAWAKDLRDKLESVGEAHDIRVTIPFHDGRKRHFLVDGRFFEFDGKKHILVTGRDTTREFDRDQSLRLLLESTNIQWGDDWFRSAACAFGDLIDAHHVAIAEWDADHPDCLTTHALFEDGESLPNRTIEIPDAALDSPVFKGEVVVREDVSREEIEKSTPFWKEGTRSVFALPIVDRDGRVIGMISMASSKSWIVTSDSETIFKIFASRAAAEIAHIHLDLEREAELERIKLLHEVSLTIRQCVDPDEVLFAATKQIGQVFRADRCHIHRCISGRVPIVAEYVAPEVPSMGHCDVPLFGNPHAETVISSDQCVVSDDTSRDPLLREQSDILEAHQIRSMMAMRITFENRTNGLVVLQQCDGPRIWTRSEQELFAAIATQIGVVAAQAEIRDRENQQRIEMDEARLKAEAASKAKGEFLARMSHELRTPLNAILGFSQLLGSDPDINESQRETLNIINRSGEHLTDLINEVLEMSKIEAGICELNMSEFPLIESIHAVTDLMRIRAENKGLGLKVDLSSELPDHIESDQTKLRQILTNLLGNAVKFTAKGFVKLNVNRIANPESTSGFALHFRVEDTGVGISPEDEEKLFAPFARFADGTASEHGTGLGLAISRGFVEFLGGRISLNSVEGKGSTFSFWIPYQDCNSQHMIVSEETELTASEIREIIEPENHNILVVDDHPANRLLATQFLKSVGFTVQEATGGKEALQKTRESRPVAILMDIWMPGMDGLTAIRKIREMDDLDEQPFIIALTGNAFEDDRAKAIDAGCDAFLAKPFRLSDLLSLLTKKLECDAAT